jgi:hypothetical protein
VAVTLQPVLVQTGTRDEEGQLAFVRDKLVAVLVLLSEQHEDEAGQWFLEHAFGRFKEHRTFPDLESAASWIAVHYDRPNEPPSVRRAP